MRPLPARILLLLGLLTTAAMAVSAGLLYVVERDVQNNVRVTATLISALLTTTLESEELTQLLQEALQATDVPMVITDPDGEPTAWKGVEGIPPDRVLPRDLLPEEHRRLDRFIQRAERDGHVFPLRFQHTLIGRLYYGWPRGVRWLRWIPVWMFALALLTVGGVVYTTRQLTHAYAQELWALFAKGLAHQMGTPLSSLLGWVERLREEHPETEPILREMDQDLAELREISLRFSRIGRAPEFQPLDVGALIQESVARMKRKLGRDIPVHVSIPPEVPRVMGDPVLLRWALENLLKNAYEARKGEPDIALQVTEEGSHVHIHIVDRGKGIDPRLRSRLFDPHTTTKRKGWGMGLWVLKRIVEDLHRGRVTLASSRPGYTHFVVSLRRESS
ncbi:MAG: HAMP domain-containing histidine kinase [Candidatus Hydrothermae bacterium]|nr:HAMP domain-containing histidine kinase [Candidatus Hydrothermae bacterium]